MAQIAKQSHAASLAERLRTKVERSGFCHKGLCIAETTAWKECYGFDELKEFSGVKLAYVSVCKCSTVFEFRFFVESKYKYKYCAYSIENGRKEYPDSTPQALWDYVWQAKKDLEKKLNKK